MDSRLPHVVIIGGGFGGLSAARALSRARVRVTLVDRRNYHLFLPLLYQVATAGLNPGDIAAPIRRILRRQTNTTVLLGEASAINLTTRTVTLTDGELPYDFLILAAGSRPSYFGHDGWAAAAPPLATVEDALEIRRRLLMAYEAAEKEEDREKQSAWLTAVVIGAGPTGVELAGAIAEMRRHGLEGEFRRFEPRRSRVILLEGVDRVLPAYPSTLSDRAAEALGRLGVEVRLSTRVSSIDESGVDLEGGDRISARCVFWAAGVAASPLTRSLGVDLDRSGRVPVGPDLSIPGHGEVFVVGDLAAVAQEGGFVPGVAQAAMQQGRHAARNISQLAAGRAPEVFRYKDPGKLATIGRAAAVADFGRVKLWGFVAWVAWLAVHIFFLIGFRNRVLVLIQWAWAYATYDRGVRLITGETRSSRTAVSPSKKQV